MTPLMALISQDESYVIQKKNCTTTLDLTVSCKNIAYDNRCLKPSSQPRS